MSISVSSTGARWAAASAEGERGYAVPAKAAAAPATTSSSSTCSTCRRTAACTAPLRNAWSRSPMARRRRSASWEYQLPPPELVGAARAVGADRRHQHSLQRHDRAARQIRAARSRVVPGRSKARSRRASVTKHSSRRCSGGLAPAIRAAAAVSGGAARELGSRWPTRRSTAAGRGCAKRSGARSRPMATRASRSRSTSAIAMTCTRLTSRSVGRAPGARGAST